ncbi:MAG: ssra-binding protein [Actinobacteria bacterium]|jgi:SsrA-binding protein|nr:ssra-binding protein [Actinomycetota bacterium]MCW3044158.1 ssra-binding protein [Actinomycetota bacterium]MEA2504327.1 SsrA-binding protein [Actinomycetota bacterium]MEA2532659.1 SsrA-binding protein [Actinomycetota bacterium]MEA2565515.1 SsrA-binding protein [Actinomycetota bacterium]
MSKKKGGAKAKSNGAVATNPKARHDYEILETMEAGMVLTGSEVKSLRGGSASMRESFAIIRDGETWLIGMHIGPYAQAGYAGHEPTRTRKLLLHKDEIQRLVGKTAERGLTLVPLKVYFNHGLAKIELGLAKGKKTYDRRESLKEKDAQMQIDRAMRRRR